MFNEEEEKKKQIEAHREEEKNLIVSELQPLLMQANGGCQCAVCFAEPCSAASHYGP